MNFKKILIFFTLIFSLFILISCDPEDNPDDPGDEVTLAYQSATLNSGVVGSTYSENIATATGATTITYTLKQGSSLPDGLSLIGPLVRGVPTTSGTTEFVIIANAENAVEPVEATFTVVIDEPADNEKPQITGAVNYTLVIGDSEPDWLANVSATDNVDGEVVVTVDDSVVNLSVAGTYDLIYEATDTAGNVRTVTVTVTVLDPADTEAPIISGTHNFELEVDDAEPNWLEGVSAMDNIDGVVTVTVDDSDVDLSAAGTYDLIYSAVDQEENERIVTVTVTVVEAEPEIKTYIYEAEYIDFTGQSGSGWSNTQTEWQMVMGDGTDATDASNGMYVVAFVPPMATLTFTFTAEEAGVGKLIFSMTTEYAMNIGGVEIMLLNPEIMTLMINGVEMDYEVPVFGRSQPNTEWQEYVFFEEFDIVEGLNTISMEMLLNDYFPGRPGGGPNLDYMKIESTLDLTMNLYYDSFEDIFNMRGY